ncbi:hypothetical protein C9J01_20875 [Photobacterium rosenbergii]|uniref:Uncharacterized protein n=1 Tax=Photobacterium rosenbergii TaxID=294936 RepID=A0A2T3N880_9GAMM|nr:DUF6482 family protein [Photobacterium rosenbergii]PSW09383.1 hypothetical protein C9J01_20875 [Photobacterium rosenbergii]
MTMPLSKLEKYFYIDKLVIHSLDLSLYQVSVVIDDEEHYVTDDKGQFLRAFSIVELQKQCRKLKAKQQVLRQQSAYDEMVGQPSRDSSNLLEVPLKDNKLY